MTRIPLLLTDGYILSVQGSSGHNCSPRTDNPNKGYGSVEIMLWKTVDDYNNKEPESYVSPSVVLDLIAEHGGIIGGQLPPLNFGNLTLVEDAILKVANEANGFPADTRPPKGDEEE